MTLIVYQNPAKVGAFGEERVLTFFEGELQRFEFAWNGGVERGAKGV